MQHLNIVMRYVDVNMVAFYERTGICFGRKPDEYAPAFEKLEGTAWSYL